MAQEKQFFELRMYETYEAEEPEASSLTNESAPECPSWFVKALTQIGGSQFDGQPNLRVVWGQSELKFVCGSEKIKYPMSSKETETYIFRLIELETGEITNCTYGQFMEAKKIYEQADPTITHLPQFKVNRSVTWVGIPRWIIEQYRPVMLLQDSPENWERNRYGWWLNPETKRQEWTDINGPFPYNGRYEHLLTVKENDGTKYGLYKPLTEATLDVLRKAVQDREAHKTQAPEIEVQNYIDKQKAELTRNEAELSDAIANELAPHVPRMYEDGTGAKIYNPHKEINGEFRKRTKSRRKSGTTRKGQLGLGAS